MTVNKGIGLLPALLGGSKQPRLAHFARATQQHKLLSLSPHIFVEYNVISKSMGTDISLPF